MIDASISKPTVDTHSRQESVTHAIKMADKVDRLTKLPSELLHNIFDFLFVRHRPDRLTYERVGWNGRLPPCDHELDRLAATCRVLRHEINDWAVHFLVQHQDITRYKPPKQAIKRDKTYNALRGRAGQGLLSWAYRHCIMCGKNTKCSAVLVNGLKCCRPCDKKHWPKITKTDACKEFDLKPYHLLPHQHDDLPAVDALRVRFPDGIPRIHYGTHDALGVMAKMFLRKDVEWLARVYHGDLESHLESRQARLEDRRQKMEEKKRAKAAAGEAAAAKARVERKPSATAVQAGSTPSVPFYVEDDEDFDE